MKVIGIGDLLIPSKYIDEAAKLLDQDLCEVSTIEWPLESYEELQNINLLVETQGAEAYQADPEFIANLQDADILITQFFPVNKRVIDSCPNLKFIGVLRGGLENVNAEYAKSRGIMVVNTAGRNATAVADFTIGMLLAECRNIAKSHLELKAGHWVRDYSNKGFVPDLEGKTLGLVGFGHIGEKVAKRAMAFDLNVVVYDPYLKVVPDYIQSVSLDELAKQADFVSLHARLSEETEHIINARFLSMMKPTAYLINTARSGLVDEQALYNALKQNTIAGAALDVFDVEPPQADYPLITLKNVTVTPHNAGGTKEAFTNSPKLLFKKFNSLLK